MFNLIAERLSKTIKNISNKGRITTDNIQETLREIRKSFLEADVSLEAIKNFIESSKNKTIGKNINNSLTPGQEFLKIIKNELIIAMGEKNHELKFSVTPPAIFLFLGLQGVGKTTTVGKVGNFIKKTKKKKILITSTDIYRAAGIQQLEILSNQIKIDFLNLQNKFQSPIEIAKFACNYAKIKNYDSLLIDTSGRLHIDEYMMIELQEIYKNTNPTETLFVIDSMMGQDAINIAKKFNRDIPISGIILTKTDSDSRGGVALSVRHIINKPIKFIGTGEKINDIALFDPKKIACKILGLENELSIIEEITNKINISQSNSLKKTIKIGKKFTLNDFLIQIKEIKNLDQIYPILNKMNSKNFFKNKLNTQFNKSTFSKLESIINSMTIKERNNPEIIKGSRKKRIALGSASKVYEINQLLKQFEEVKKMMKKFKNHGINNMIQKIKNFF